MIAVDSLTKRYRSVTAVDDLSFEVHPGRVTGFLGPNGISGVDLLAPWLAVLLMLAWIGAAFAGGAALLRRADLH